MLPSALVRAYGTQAAVADACGVTFQAVSRWVLQGYVPWNRQLDIQHRTAGRFRARMADIPADFRPRTGPGSGLARGADPGGDAAAASTGTEG